MPARMCCLPSHGHCPYPKLDPDASAARYPSQTSTMPYHTKSGKMNVVHRYRVLAMHQASLESTFTVLRRQDTEHRTALKIQNKETMMYLQG